MMLLNQAGPPLSPMPMPMPATVTDMDDSHRFLDQPPPQVPQPQQRLRRKRKAEFQDANNERLSKRMSLLNLEHNGPKLYVPVEQPQIAQHQHQLQQPIQSSYNAPLTTGNNDSLAAAAAAAAAAAQEEPMHLDDTSHKVYIYNLDDELSSDNESDVEDREGKLVFLPDIEKHLRANRMPLPLSSVPRPILPNKDGELAGMQLVLYSDGPSSITVPEEQDSVRKAVLEARARVRQRQAEERGQTLPLAHAGRPNAAAAVTDAARTGGKVSFATPVRVSRPAEDGADMMLDDQTVPQPSASATGEYDPDAMDID